MREKIPRPLKCMENSQPTNADILEAINEFAGNVEERFERVDERFDGIDKRLDSMDSKLFEMSRERVA